MFTLDHVKPLSEGGADNLTNLVACCYECNQLRSRSETRQEYRLHPEYLRFRRLK
jgi:5-methylcytosine-specific restriction endonuclease McrA